MSLPLTTYKASIVSTLSTIYISVFCLSISESALGSLQDTITTISFENLRTTVLFLLWRTTDLLFGFALVTDHQFIKAPKSLASLGDDFKLE